MNTDLEKEFKIAYDTAIPLLKEKEAEIKRSIEEMINICEEYGIQYKTPIALLWTLNCYTPFSFLKKWNGLLDGDYLDKYIWNHEDGLGGGWLHSAVCW